MSTVIRSPNWIGDGIMSLPAIRAHKDRFPDERLAVLAKSYLADIYLNIPEIDEIIPIPDRWSLRSYFSCLRELRKKRFDRGILFTNSFSSALFYRLAGIARLAGYGRDHRGWLLHDRVPGLGQYTHHQNYYLGIVGHLAGEKIRGAFPATLVVTAPEREWADHWLAEQGIRRGTPILAVSPAAAYGSAKAWPPGRFREAIRRWGKSHPEAAVLLLGAAGERPGIAAIAAGLPGRVVNLAGRLDLRRSIAVLSRCRLFIGNDSGTMHIAAALGVPLAAIFGPTEPGRTAPLAERFRLLHHGADCAPCRRRRCPTDHRCMTAIGVDEVLSAAGELWQGGSPEAP
jgi:heptosyltransferase II